MTLLGELYLKVSGGEIMLNIAYIPIDERPCNYDFLLKASQIGNFNLNMPERNSLGKFLLPGNIHEIKEWLLTIRNAEYLILSMDMLLYGGLIASREYAIDCLEESAIRDSLKSFRKNNPAAKVYAFNIIMRTSISIKDDETARYWKYINEFSKLIHEEEKNASRIQTLKELIPKKLLCNYLQVRKRNHENNNFSIKLVEEGLVDFLVLGQEDCSKEGIHINEQYKLKERIQAERLEEQILIMTGADELGQVFLARALNDRGKFKCGRVIYDVESNKRAVSQFENLPLEDTMDLHIKACCFDGEAVEEDYVFYVVTPRYYDSFVDDASMKTLTKMNIKEVADESRLMKLISEKKTILFDLCHANGGCNALMQFLKDKNMLNKLFGYTAWNTSSNSIGTGLMIYALHKFTDGKRIEQLYEFTLERIVDDYIYQRIVRQKISSKLTADGENIFRFKNGSYSGELNRLLQKEIEEYKPCLLNDSIKGFSFEADFPWERVFEISINIEVLI
jgi:hypothetical protein